MTTVLVNIESSKPDSQGQRTVKVVRLGRFDVRDRHVIAPQGVDAAPTKNRKGVFMDTSALGQEVIAGVVNGNQKAEAGEIRLFAEDTEGNEVFSIHLKKDGTVEMGGAEYNLTRYQQLEQGFNELRDRFNELVLAYNTHIHPSTSGTLSPTATQAASSSADISGAKINELKTL